jgi:hypothetical protein
MDCDTWSEILNRIELRVGYKIENFKFDIFDALYSNITQHVINIRTTGGTTIQGINLVSDIIKEYFSYDCCSVGIVKTEINYITVIVHFYNK